MNFFITAIHHLVTCLTLIALYSFPIFSIEIHFEIRELGNDYQQTNPKRIETHLHHPIRYTIPKLSVPPGGNLTYHISKPYWLRKVEYPMFFGNDVLLNDNDDKFIIEFKQVNFYHQGNYSIYQFVFNNNSRLVNQSRFDLNLVITGLKQLNSFCNKDYECESGSCRYPKCICSKQYPINYNDRCLQAKHLNETCETDVQCQYYGGRLAECFPNWGQCRCKANSTPIKVGPNQYYCVRLAMLHEPCMYSKQCSLTGTSRYCNASYLCDCLPGYHYQHRLSNIKCQISSGYLPIEHTAVPLSTMIIVLLINRNLFGYG